MTPMAAMASMAAGTGRQGGSGDAIRALAVATELGGRAVLKGVDLAIPRGGVFVILGPSGCGKTTMLRHLCGLLPPSVGSISVGGRDLYTMPPDALHRFRLSTGLAFQGGALLGSLTVAENVALPLVENTDLDRVVIRQLVRLKLDMVGLLDAADLLPSSLSGGMRKRAAIARAVALDPEFLFLDEPSSGLDPVTAASLDDLVLRLNAVFGITVVVVTHDLPSAFAIADRVAVFHGGRVIAQGPRDEVLADRDPRIRDLVERRAAPVGSGADELTRILQL